MMESMMEWASQPSTARWVLAVAVLVIFVGAIRASEQVFWADMIEEDD